MFRADVKERKATCWQSQWRGVGNDGTGRPTHYVPLTQDEMMHAAATGHVAIPESQMPAAVIAQRDRMAEIAADMGVTLDDATLRNQIAKIALEEALA